MATLAEIREILARGESVTIPNSYVPLFMEECSANPIGTECFNIKCEKGMTTITDETALRLIALRAGNQRP